MASAMANPKPPVTTTLAPLSSKPVTNVSQVPAVQHTLIGQSGKQSSTPAKSSKDGPKSMKSKYSRLDIKNTTHAGKTQSTQDVFHKEIHTMELKEATERRAEKNAIRIKELELEEKWQELEKEKHQAKLRKMEIEAEHQQMQMNMLTNMIQMSMQQTGHYNGSSTGGQPGQSSSAG
jgi:hypothetical protein